MPEPFHSARLKVERAKKHIDDLRRELTVLLNPDLYPLSIKKDADTGEPYSSFDIPPLPEHIPLIVGDTIHNLSASLDHAAYEVVTMAGGDGAKAKFPFREKRQELVGVIQNGQVEMAPPGSRLNTIILDVIRPHEDDRGNRPLYALHDLDIADKHHLLLAVIGHVALQRVSFKSGPFNVVGLTVVSPMGHEQRLIQGTQHVEMQERPQPALDVLFNEGFFKDQPVIPTLEQLSELVSEILLMIHMATVPAPRPGP